MDKQELQLIRQPNNYTCIAAVAAMVTRTKFEDFIAFAGHDGSDNFPDSPHPDKVRGFDMTELAVYLALHGWHLGCWLDADLKKPKDVTAETLSIWSVDSRTLPPPNQHVVVWTGEVVMDPNYDELQKQDEYTVTEWWPIIKWATYAKPLWQRLHLAPPKDGKTYTIAELEAMDGSKIEILPNGDIREKEAGS